MALNSNPFLSKNQTQNNKHGNLMDSLLNKPTTNLIGIQLPNSISALMPNPTLSIKNQNIQNSGNLPSSYKNKIEQKVNDLVQKNISLEPQNNNKNSGNIKILTELQKQTILNKNKENKLKNQIIRYVNIFNEKQISKINQSSNKRKNILNYIKLLLQLIKGNNQNMLQALNSKNIKQNQLTIHQINRLKIGLKFYQNNYHPLMMFLQKAIQKSILGNLFNQVHNKYKQMDSLKIFYLLRQAFITKKIINQNDFLFFKINKQALINKQQILCTIQKFLEEDKINLLQCYKIILQKQENKQCFSLWTQHQQLFIHYFNFNDINKQTEKIKQKGIDLFVKYFQKYKNSNNQILLSYMKCLKKKILSSNIQNKYKELLICLDLAEMIKKGSLVQNQLYGVNLILYKILIKKQSYNLTAAVKEIQNSQITVQWIPYLQQFIRDNKINNSQQKFHKIQYSSFLFIVCTKLKNPISQISQQILIKNIFKNGSIILAINLASRSKQAPLMIWIAKALKNYKQQQFQNIQEKQYCILLSIFQNYKRQDLSLNYIKLIDKIYDFYFNNNDFQSLQLAISGKTMNFYSLTQNNVTIQFIKFYYLLNERIQKYQIQIIKNLYKMFYKLKQNNIKISSSLSFVNRNMLKKDNKMANIYNYLNFYFSILDNNDNKAHQIKFWLKKIEQKVDQKDKQSILNMLILYLDNFIKIQNIFPYNYLSKLLNIFQNQLNNIIINRSVDVQILIQIVVKWKKCLQIQKITNIQKSQNQNILQIYQKQFNTFISKFSNIFHHIFDKTASQSQNIGDKTKFVNRILFINYYLELQQNQSNSSQNSRNNSAIFVLVDKNLQKKYNYLILRLSKSTLPDQFLIYKSFYKVSSVYFNKFIKNQSLLIKQKIINFNIKTSHQFYQIVQIAKLLINQNDNIYQQANYKQICNVLVKLILIKIYKQLDKNLIKSGIFDIILYVLMKSLNGIQYSLHLKFLIYGLKMNYLNNQNIILKNKISQYSLYILCIHIVKRKSNVDLNNIKQRQQLENEFNIFTSFAIMIISLNKNRNEEFNEYSKIYLNKLITIFKNASNQIYMQPTILKSLKLIKSSVKEAIIYKNTGFQYLKQFGQNLNYFLNKKQNKQNNFVINQNNYQQNLYHLTQKLQQAKSNKQFKNSLLKINNFIKKHQNFKLKNFYIEIVSYKKAIQSNFPWWLVLSHINLLINSIDNRFYLTKTNVKSCQNVSKYISNCFEYKSGLFEMIQLKQSLKITLQLLQNMMISPLTLININQDQIINLFSNLRILLKNWNFDSKNTKLKQFEKYRIILSKQFIDSRQHFTLFHLVVCIEKIKIINLILQIYNKVLGLIQIQKQKFVRQIQQFLVILSQNLTSFQIGFNSLKPYYQNLFEQQKIHHTSLINQFQKITDAKQIKRNILDILNKMIMLNMSIYHQQLIQISL